MSRNNANFKRISRALKLTKDEIHEIMGGQVSKNVIDCWGRGESSRRNDSHGKRKRMIVMTDSQFDRFCTGLVEWSHKNIEGIEKKSTVWLK